MPILTYVPPHILIIAQLSNIERSQLQIDDENIDIMKKKLDDRDIRGGYYASWMMESITEYHQSNMKELNKVIQNQVTFNSINDGDNLSTLNGIALIQTS